MMPGLPDRIVPRVQQLVRLLASDHDGEVLAAARALGRTLGGEKKSFHDLADAVETDRPTTNPYPGRYATSAVYDPEYDDVAPNLREPPTWIELRDFERRDWATVFVRQLDIPGPFEKSAATALRFKLINRRDTPVTAAEVKLFNGLMARAWRVGLRP